MTNGLTITTTVKTAIAREVIDEYARYKPSYGQSDMSVVYDSDRDRYLLVSFGWNIETLFY